MDMHRQSAGRLAIGLAALMALPLLTAAPRYAEMKGDRLSFELDPDDVAVVKEVKQAGVPTVVVLVSGRPMILEPILGAADAILAAWLPGSEGGGVADVLFGKYKPTGKLGHSWPKSMAQVPTNVGPTGVRPGQGPAVRVRVRAELSVAISPLRRQDAAIAARRSNLGVRPDASSTESLPPSRTG